MFRFLILFSLWQVLSACSTLSSQKTETQDQAPSTILYQKTPIVQQTSGKTVLRKLSRDAWVEIRKSSKDEHTRLYATLGAGEWDVAIADARSLLQKKPKDEVGLMVLALALAMKRNYSLAAYYADLLDKHYPGNPEVWNLRGLAAMHKPSATLRDLDKAKKAFETAFDASGQQIASGLNLAYLYLEMGNAEGARDIYQAVAGRCDNCQEATLGYGIALSRLSDFAKAEEVFQKILEKDRKNPYARFYLALVAKYGKGDNAGAIKQLSDLVEDPDLKNDEMRRKSNFLLRRIQAEVYGQSKGEGTLKPGKAQKLDQEEMNKALEEADEGVKASDEFAN